MLEFLCLGDRVVLIKMRTSGVFGDGDAGAVSELAGTASECLGMH